MTPTEKQHLGTIELLRSLMRIAVESADYIDDLPFYLDYLEQRGRTNPKLNVITRPELKINAPEDLRLCLEEERDLARAFSSFAKVAIRVAKKHDLRKGRSVEEWVALLGRTADST